MVEKRPALGRGLSALIPDAKPPATAAASESPASGAPREMDIDRLVPNPRQPRTVIDEHRLEELAQSIRGHGVIQPILARQVDGRFEIVAGERRWRAAQRAGLLKVPVVIRQVEDEHLLQVALIENIQREDLNAIEEALAYKRLCEEGHMTQDEVAAAVGKDRATVSNYMRLLRLPVEVRNDLASSALSMGHARALLALSDEASQRRIAREIISRGLSVREAETLTRRESSPPAPPPPARKVDANTRAAEEQLKLALGTGVRILRKGKGGRLEIEFSSEDELQRLYELFTA